MIKPTIFDLMYRHHLSIHQVATAAQITEHVAWSAFLNAPIQKSYAEAILRGISQLTRQEYTLDNVEVPVR